jgi:Tfp pilus assembly protein PilP
MSTTCTPFARYEVLVLGLVLGLWPAVAGAQAGRAAAPAGSAVATSAVSQGYGYNPDGRRDPFVSLVDRGSEIAASSVRPQGLAGLMLHEIAVKGIVLNEGSYLALVQGPDSRTYVVRHGDKLFDAGIKAVTADAVVFVQQVNDPLSLVKQREIRKPLRPAEEGK